MFYTESRTIAANYGRNDKVNALSALLNLPEADRTARGLVHTPSEISQQPDTWLSTFDLFRKKMPEIKQFLSSAELSSPPIVFLVGAGTSDYIGHSLANLLRNLWHCEVIAVASTDLLTHMDEFVLPKRKYLWISFSRSGDSPEGVAVLEKALQRYPDIHQLIISCNANGRMVRENAGKPQVLCVCLDDAVNDRGLAMTSSFSNMVIFGQCLAHISDLTEYEQVLMKLTLTGKSFLPIAADRAAELAQDGYKKACFVGSGALKAIAVESALKLLELTAGKTLAVSESALGLRHGPMAVLDQQTMFVCLLSGNKRVQKYERDLLAEIGSKQLVKSRVVVTGNGFSASDTFAEHFVAPVVHLDVADDYRTVIDVMFGQLLGMFFSLRCGLKPDSPSPSGAINRVVQNINIHA